MPVRGSSVCGPGAGDPEEIQVTLSFDYDVEGRLIAQPRGTAKYGASARVVDPAGNNLYFESLPSQRATGGVTFVKFVPIPTPTFPDATVKERSVFQVTVKRGDMNRFAVSVAARVDTGSLIGGGGDVLLTTGKPFPGSDGHVSIPNVSIDVGVEGGGSDDGPMQELQQQIAELSEQLEDLDLRVDSRFGDLNSDLTERLEGLDDVDEGLQSQLDTLLALVTALQGQVDAQAGELTALEDRTTGLEARLTASEEKATGLEEQLSEQEQQISELEGKNTALESQLSDQSQRLSKVEGKAADFEAQLSEQAQQLAELAEEFANHTHDYEAPKGNGNNSKTSETGPPR